MTRRELKDVEMTKSKNGFKPEEKDVPTTIDRDGTRTEQAKLKSAKIVAAQRRRAKKQQEYNDRETEFREGNLRYVADKNMRQLRREKNQSRERV